MPDDVTSAESRQTRRIPVRFRAEYEGRQVRGAGTVENISLGGALIEQTSVPLLAGGELRVRFSFFGDSVPIELRAEVVRETERGFAVQFVGMNRRIRSLLAIAIGRAAREPVEGEVAGLLELETPSE